MMPKMLRRDEAGAAAIEMAVALPILIGFLYGIMQIGMIMAADAGMQHALGEGARMATLYPTPGAASIRSKIESKVFGPYVGSYTFYDPTTVKAGTTKYMDLRITFKVQPTFLFVTAPEINFQRTKRVYIT